MTVFKTAKECISKESANIFLTGNNAIVDSKITNGCMTARSNEAYVSGIFIRQGFSAYEVVNGMVIAFYCSPKAIYRPPPICSHIDIVGNSNGFALVTVPPLVQPGQTFGRSNYYITVGIHYITFRLFINHVNPIKLVYKQFYLLSPSNSVYSLTKRSYIEIIIFAQSQTIYRIDS